MMCSRALGVDKHSSESRCQDSGATTENFNAFAILRSN